MPAIGCFTAIIWVSQLFYAIGSSTGLQVISCSPQEVVLVLAVVGMGGCLVSCLAVPRMMRQLKTRGPTIISIKRMNLLGLVRPASWVLP